MWSNGNYEYFSVNHDLKNSKIKVVCKAELFPLVLVRKTWAVAQRKLRPRFKEERFEGRVSSSFSPEKCSLLWRCFKFALVFHTATSAMPCQGHKFYAIHYNKSFFFYVKWILKTFSVYHQHGFEILTGKF